MVHANKCADPGVAFLLTGALAIEDNLLSCLFQGITLNGTVLHLLSTRITGNEVLGWSWR